MACCRIHRIDGSGRCRRRAADLKLVALRMHSRNSAELRLHRKALGPVTAGDIQPITTSEVVNPELVLANLTKAGERTCKMKIERGRGYRPAVQRVTFEEQTRPIGAWLDASFSPVRRVTLLGRVRPR